MRYGARPCFFQAFRLDYGDRDVIFVHHAFKEPSMNRAPLQVVVIVFVCFLLNGTSIAVASAPSDNDLLTSLLSASVTCILDKTDNLDGSKALITYPALCMPGVKPRQAVEAVVTAAGLSIVDDLSSAETVIDVSIVEARVTIRMDSIQSRRTASVAIYVECSRTNGDIVYVSGDNQLYEDMLDNDDIARTDNANDFCPITVRRVIRKSPSAALMASFAVVTSVIAYFAFK